MSAVVTIELVVPAGYSPGDYAMLFGNGGSGSIDWESPVTEQKYDLFPNGAGIYGWGRAPWGRHRWGRAHSMRTPGWARLPWGRHPWGHGSAVLDIPVELDSCGDYTFALACYDAAGNQHEGEPGELTVNVHTGAPAPAALSMDYYNPNMGRLVLAAPADPWRIWYHGMYYSNAPLYTALSSGLLSHVVIARGHRNDFTWDGAANAIAAVKAAGVKFIAARCLWPLYDMGDCELADFFRRDYYIQEIEALRAEALELGADYCALDNEPYADSIFKYYLSGSYYPTDAEHAQLDAAITAAAAAVGKVDFIYHAGAITRDAFRIIAQLGRNRIVEQTYWYDPPRYSTITYPWDIFGVFLNTTRTREEKPEAPYFLVSDALDDLAALWTGEKGVFLYTTAALYADVADALLEHAT